ncbi:MAG: SPFH domain-containing protein [Chitinophagales bacterium]|jgi:hypothetical protein
MRFLYFFSVIGFLQLAACNGCRQIPANQIVLNSDNYGKTWRELNKNETVPACRLPGCYNLYLPATTMGGELGSTQRVGKTGEAAKVKMLYTYMWEIADPLKFVTEAKELRGGGDYTSDASLEIIESRLIDRHFHDISAKLLVDEDVKSFDQARFEARLTPELNKDMEQYGVRITAVSVVPEFGEQLETALDAAQALEVYKSIGEEALGKDIIRAKAGATNLNFHTSSQQ